MRVVFLTHYFWPEVGAPQTRLLELARALSAGGDEVTVVTGMPNYPTGVVPDRYRGHLALEQRIDGVRVVRRWVYAAPNAGFAKRLANHLSFVASSLTAMHAAGPADVLVVESPPLPIGLAALSYSSVKRAPFVLNVSDIWPQSAVELGALRNRTAIRLAEMFERHLYRRAARVAVPTPGMVENLASRGVPRDKLVHLSNGVDVELYRPTPLPSGRKVFMYAGTHGLSQGLDVILEAARLIDDPNVEFVLAGEGADKAALVEKAEREGIANVRFLPNQPQAAMPRVIDQAYATVVTLKRLDVFKRARPSKMYESMASGRPIVASMWGEAADLVRETGCGIVVEPEDPAALAEAVRRLAADPELAREMGARGRAYAVEHFDRAKIAVHLRRVLGEVVAERRRPARAGRFDRAIDLAIGLPALVASAPLIAAAAVAVKVDSSGPVFYSGPRVGKDGKIFRMHKLRTMRTDADAKGPAVTAGDDPRVTRAGRILRRTKLDELPQLLNVVKGDMSLVGPRPEHPAYVSRYTPAQRRVLTVRPGVTGPATLAFIDEEEQLRGQKSPETAYVTTIMPRKLDIELDYLDHAKPSTRLSILLRTGAAVLRRPFESSRGSSARSRSQPE